MPDTLPELDDIERSWAFADTDAKITLWAFKHADRLLAIARQLEAQVAAGQREEAVGDEAGLANEIGAELARARAKFPGKNVTFAALVEEVGELATATFEESRERVRKEAVQVAVMAMRMVLDGDHTFDDWRAAKGLDALTSEARNGQ